MPQFLVHTQQGGGCDYTIGCGHRINIISADDLKDAIEQVRREWFGLMPEAPLAPGDEEEEEEFDSMCAIRSGDGIEKVVIYEIGAEVGLDVAGLFREVAGRKAAKEKVAKEVRDRAQFEALKAQFEPKS